MIIQDNGNIGNGLSEDKLLPWGIDVAGYRLRFKSDDEALRTLNPPQPNLFIFQNKAVDGKIPAFSHTMTLEVIQKELDRENRWEKLINHTMIWELWERNDWEMVLSNPVQPVLRQVIFRKDFSGGQVFGDFGSEPGELILPKELEIVLYVNWLGRYGDLILHAAAVAIGSDGYAFIGQSHAGKSTIARLLATDSDIRVFGEDQVVLRNIDGEFWLFGSPWHFYSSLFAPEAVRLKGLFFLEGKGMQPLTKLSPMEGVKRIMQTAFVPYYNSPAVEKILANLGRLAESVRLQAIGFDLEESAQELIERLLHQ